MPPPCAKSVARSACTALVLFSCATPAVADPAPPPPVEGPFPDKSAYTLFNPTPADRMRGFSTDRPTRSNLPYTVDAGHFQVETDIAVFATDARDGTRITGWTVFDPTLKLGLTSTIDLEVQLSPFQSVTVTGAGGRRTASGWGDTYARIKFNVLGDDGGKLAIALLPYVKAPTARAALGNGAAEGGLIVPVSMTAPHGFTVVFAPEIDHLRDAATPGYHEVADFLINVSHPVGKSWTVYAEAFTAHSFQTGERPVTTLDAAVSLAITPQLQWDVGGNFRVSGAVPAAQIYTGLSRRL